MKVSEDGMTIRERMEDNRWLSKISVNTAEGNGKMRERHEGKDRSRSFGSLGFFFRQYQAKNGSTSRIAETFSAFRGSGWEKLIEFEIFSQQLDLDLRVDEK